jgi:hypothetical protein
VVTGPFFLATKIEAFYNRGKGDFMVSHDMEDMVTLLDGRPELAEEVRTTPGKEKIHLSNFQGFPAKQGFP